MKKQILILLVGILMMGSAQAQQTDKENKIVPWENPLTERMGYANGVRKNNATRWTVPNSLIQTDLVEVWGMGGSLVFNKKSVSYVDWAIPAQYDRVSKKFSEKLAGVILNGKVGFIDRKNRFIIPPKFDAVKDLQSFSQGLAVVCVNGKYGFINKRGDFVIEPIYEWADNFRDNLLASVKQGGKYGAIDITGALVVPCKYKLEEAMINVPISNKEYRKAAKNNEEKRESGAFDETLKKVESVSREVDALIDDDSFLPPIPELEYVTKVENGLLGVTTLEQDSAWILPPRYTDVEVVDRGLMLIEENERFMGVADYHGRIVLPCEYLSVELKDDLGLFIVQKDSLYGLYDTNGIEVMPVSLDAIEDFEGSKARAWINGVAGWVDVDGNLQEGFLDNVYRSAVLLEESGKGREARRIYENILDINPGYALAYNNLGIMELEAENYGLGIKKLKLANRLDPDNKQIEANLEQAKKDRKERRWSRVMKGLETAQVALGVAATTYNAVEAAKGGSNFVDVDAVMNGTATPTDYSSNNVSNVNYTPMNNASNPVMMDLAQERAKLQELQAEREILVKQQTALIKSTSRQGVRETRRAGTSLRLNRGQYRPGQGNYGRGVAERNSYEFAGSKVKIKSVDRRIAACRQRIRALEDELSGDSYASTESSTPSSRLASSSDDSKGVKTGSDVYHFNKANDLYYKIYSDLLVMKTSGAGYENLSCEQINNLRRERQARMKAIRKKWEAKGEQMGNSDTIAMEDWPGPC